MNQPLYHHYSEYSLLGSKFSTNLLFAASKCTSQYNDSGSSRCSKWPNDRMVAVVKHCWLKEEEAAEKDDKDNNCWKDVQENIGMFSKS